MYGGCGVVVVGWVDDLVEVLYCFDGGDVGGDLG